MNRCTLWFGVVLLVGLIQTNIFAQDSLRTGIKYGLLPLVSFNTDDGIYLGGEVQRYDYRDQLPFRSYTVVRASYKTIGAFGLAITRDQVRTFGTDIRTASDLLITQNLGDYYFGDTEKFEFNRARFDTSNYYAFKSFRVNVGVVSRYPLQFGEGISRLDFKVGLRFVYETPWGTPSSRFMHQKNITGSEGAFLSFIETGIYLERRDSEFRAVRGYSIDAGVKYAPPIIGTHHTLLNNVQLKAFIPVVEELPISLAMRISLQTTVGDTPYWFKPSLGGVGTIRGFIYRRFVSDNALSYSVEVRSWLLKFPWKNLEFGLTAFADGGRVFTNQNWRGIFNHHNSSLGLGGVMSIFTPDFIMKYEMGFSKEGAGVYLGTGYSF